MVVGAVDIGGTKIAVGLVDKNGSLIDSHEMPTRPELGVRSAVERITAALKTMQTAQQIPLEGIGIGCTGPVDPVTRELGIIDFLPGWQGSGLVEGLEDALKLPAALENDADAAALAECHWGSGKDCEVFLYVTISTGIGIGIVINGRLFRGAGGTHPEIGHHVIDPAGPLCCCGANGCWESLASGPALARYYTALNPAAIDPAGMDARKVCQRAMEGEQEAIQAVAHHARYLGIGLANLVTIFTPDRIALGGGLMKAWPLFEPTVKETIRSTCGYVPHERTKIELASLGPQIALLGAGRVWFYQNQKK